MVWFSKIGSVLIVSAILVLAYFSQPFFKIGNDQMPIGAMGGGQFFAGEDGMRTHVSFRKSDEIRDSDNLALKGSMAMADEKYGEAISNYFNALKKLPSWKQAQPRRAAYRKQFWNAVKKLVGL